MMLAEEEYKNNKKSEMKDDAMKNLEYRTYDSKREMDILEATDKVKELNRREAHIDFDYLIKKVRESDKEKKEKEKENNQEKKEIEKMYKNLDKEKINKNIFDKLIKDEDKKLKENNKEKDEKKIEPLINTFFLKKKVEREEKEIDKNKDNKSNHFLSDDDSSDNLEEEKNIKDIFKKPLINFSQKLGNKYKKNKI